MRCLKASATIEVAYIMPVVFLVLTAIIYVLFYAHDKSIIMGAAYETAVIVAQKERMQVEEVSPQECFDERIGNKLILFSNVTIGAEQREEEIIITAQAEKKRMKIYLQVRAAVIHPEQYIRDVRRLESGLQEIVP